MKNEQREYITDVTQTSSAVTITWTTHEPTASTLQTIADGTAATSVELAQAVQNINTQMAAVVVDLAAIIAKINA
jgi:hypothetical protein